jgi:acyl-coenzyme A synthetase/AMP-(fatty) acid ligase
MNKSVMTAGLPLLAARDLDAPMAWHDGRSVSGRQFLADAARLAAQLPTPGPAVNLCADRYAFAVGLAAALMRGQASLLPPDARADTLSRIGELAGSDSPVYAVVDHPELETPGMARVVVDPAALEIRDDALVDVPLIDRHLHAVSLLTSGSTGVPQPHAKHWHGLVDNVTAATARLCALLHRPSLAGLTLVSTVPVQHSYGLESTVLLAMLGGAAFHSGRAFFPADVAQALASVPAPRALVTTPFHLKTLLLAGIELPPVDLILSATAPLSPQLAAQAESAMGGVLIEIYGSTETGQVASRRPTQSEVWETFGAVRVRVEPHAAGQEGVEGSDRFIVEGDFVLEATVVADVLELIDERHFRLLGRANDLIHVAGRRSSLGHLNYHLNSIAGVEDGAFWLPDDVRDGVVRPVAFVVAPGISASDLIAALRQRLEPVFVPRRVVHVAALPRVGTGKLTVRALREFALAQLAEDGAAVQVSLDVPLDHPAFAGHFPGQPLMPGALLLSEVLEAMSGVPALVARLGDRPTLAVAKFLAPVRPGDSLTIELQPEPAGARGVRFEVRCGAQVVVNGRWIAGPEAGT